jgi:hypothetical protein
MHSIFRNHFKRRLVLNDIDNTPEECKFVGGRFAIPLDDVADVLEDEGVHWGALSVDELFSAIKEIFGCTY